MIAESKTFPEVNIQTEKYFTLEKQYKHKQEMQV